MYKVNLIGYECTERRIIIEDAFLMQDTRIQGFKDARIQRCEDTKMQEYKDAKIQRYKMQEIYVRKAFLEMAHG